MDPYLQAYSNNTSAGAGYAKDAAVGPTSAISKRGRVITTTSITSASTNKKDVYDGTSKGSSSSNQSQSQQKKSKSLLSIWKNVSKKQKKKRGQQNFQRRRNPVPVGGHGAPC